MPKRSPAAWLFAVALLLLMTAVVDRWRPSFDGGIYIALGRSLASGEGYRYLSHGYSKFPPGLPLLLAGLELLGGRSFFLMRAAMAVFAALAISLAYLLLREALPRSLAFAIAIVTLFNAPLWRESTEILSDLPFMATVFGTLLLLAKEARSPSGGKALAIAVLLLLAFLFRTAALPLLPLVLVVGLVRPYGPTLLRRLLVVLPSLVFLAFWTARPRFIENPFPSGFPEASSYIHELLAADWRNPESEAGGIETLVARVRSNGSFHLGVLSNLLTGFALDRLLPKILTGGWWAVGFLLALRRGRPGALFTLLYVLLYLLWPAQEPRFLLVLLPILVAQALEPLLDAAGRFRLPVARDPARRGPLFASLALTLVMAAPHLPGIVRFVRDEHREPYLERGALALASALASFEDLIPKDAVVVTDRAPWVHILSGRRCYAFPRLPDPDRVMDAVLSIGATHVLADDREFAVRFLNPAIVKHRHRFRELGRQGPHILYGVL
jgi:4-amino-4-deoxy-L-arabinose transferase-like glycosyltransferase